MLAVIAQFWERQIKNLKVTCSISMFTAPVSICITWLFNKKISYYFFLKSQWINEKIFTDEFSFLMIVGIAQLGGCQIEIWRSRVRSTFTAPNSSYVTCLFFF